MLYAMKLGPIATTEGFVYAYFATSARHQLDPIMVAGDEEGLRGLLAEHPEVKKGDLLCEKALFKAGKPLGFKVAKPEQAAIYMKASMAMLLALANTLDGHHPRTLAVIQALAGSSSQLHAWQPWGRIGENEILHVRVKGELERRYEMLVLGEKHDPPGILLFEKPGAAARVAAGGSYDDEDHIGLFWEDSPEYACQALEAAVGMPLYPRAYSWQEGQNEPIDSIEILVIVHVIVGLMEMFQGEVDRSAGGIPIDGPDAPVPLTVEVSVQPIAG